ncbi:hypothetical protein QYF36_006451 [Acer negundo]|nr:hypothetical protein QYF36_006451 [Acer negundo]
MMRGLLRPRLRTFLCLGLESRGIVSGWTEEEDAAVDWVWVEDFLDLQKDEPLDLNLNKLPEKGRVEVEGRKEDIHSSYISGRGKPEKTGLVSTCQIKERGDRLKVHCKSMASDRKATVTVLIRWKVFIKLEVK